MSSSTQEDLPGSGALHDELAPGAEAKKESKAVGRILTVEFAALPQELAARTDVLPAPPARWWERALEQVGLGGMARRSRHLRRSWMLFRRAPQYQVIVTLGDLEGLAFGALQRLHGRKRAVHIMYDCLWYGGGWLRCASMRFCLRAVDCCVVWASVECQRYSSAYGLPLGKFFYVPHHHTLHHFEVQAGDGGYIFTGGNADRDYGLFFDAVRELNAPCVLATNRPRLLQGLQVPACVRVESLSHAQFRQRLAEAHIVVMPMRATLLHAGAQQSILNAMLLGKPVILTDPEGGRDYIDSGKTGLLVPYGDPAALRDAIRYLLDHPEEARNIGERARRASAPFTVMNCNTMIWTRGAELAQCRFAAAQSYTPAHSGV